MFLSQVADEIREIIAAEEVYLSSLDRDTVSTKFNVQNRSIKQIVGHLIDSASNNLHRIVHLQYNETPLVFPNYASNGNNDRWIATQNYQEEDWNLLVQLLKYSNLHIAYVIEQIATKKMDNKWIASPGNEVSLKEMIMDYPRHLKLHIGEIKDLHAN